MNTSFMSLANSITASGRTHSVDAVAVGARVTVADDNCGVSAVFSLVTIEVLDTSVHP